MHMTEPTLYFITARAAAPMGWATRHELRHEHKLSYSVDTVLSHLLRSLQHKLANGGAPAAAYISAATSTRELCWLQLGARGPRGVPIMYTAGTHIWAGIICASSPYMQAGWHHLCPPPL